MLVTDTVPEGFEKFELSNGKTYCGRANGCFFCSHLTDIFLDWNGPYAVVCDCHDDTSKGLSGECPFFKKHRPGLHLSEMDGYDGWYSDCPMTNCPGVGAELKE